MSIDTPKGGHPLLPKSQPPWGEFTEEGKPVLVIRFVTAERTVSYPIDRMRRWELLAGDTDRILIAVDQDEIEVQGHGLAEVCAGLDLVAVRELRASHNLRKRAPGGAHIDRIAIRTA